jgi:hypothetical protein
MRVHVGFCIEARSDEELDEIMLGCCKLSLLDISAAKFLRV